jgi:hypothetical protein
VVQRTFKNFEVLKFVAATTALLARAPDTPAVVVPSPSRADSAGAGVGIVSLAVAAASRDRTERVPVALPAEVRGEALWDSEEDLDSEAPDPVPVPAVVPARVFVAGEGLRAAHEPGAPRGVCKRRRGQSSGVGEWACAFCMKSYKYDGSCAKHERICRHRNGPV